MIKKVTAMYFSATGTTRKVASYLAEKIAEDIGAEYEEYGFTKPGRRIHAPAFGAEDLVVFGTPVYAGRVPNVLLDFIGKVSFDGTPVVTVVLYGNRNFDDALKELSGILRGNGADVIGAGAFIGEHAFSRELAAGRPDEKDMAVAGSLAKAVALKIKSCVDMTGGAGSGDESAFKAFDVYEEITGEEPPRPYYKPRDSKGNFIDIRKVVPVTGDTCDGCGICAEVCPMGSIDPLHVSRMKGICIKCGACVKRCPRGAKYFDDPGFIYHKEELEKMYAERKDPEIFI